MVREDIFPLAVLAENFGKSWKNSDFLAFFSPLKIASVLLEIIQVFNES